MDIWFDMDGTIADLYGVEGWLTDLINERVRPYAQAKPLVNMSRLARVLNKLQKQGCTINIISWGSKGASQNYNKAVADTKRKWLAKHLASVKFDRIQVVAYGTPKGVGRNGILFDDEERNRTQWGDGAYTEAQIFEVLARLA